MVNWCLSLEISSFAATGARLVTFLGLALCHSKAETVRQSFF